jgi:hypothetical protein
MKEKKSLPQKDWHVVNNGHWRLVPTVMPPPLPMWTRTVEKKIQKEKCFRRKWGVISSRAFLADLCNQELILVWLLPP